jgi:hypothetical protein
MPRDRASADDASARRESVRRRREFVAPSEVRYTARSVGLRGRIVGVANRILAPVGAEIVRRGLRQQADATAARVVEVEAQLARVDAALTRGWVRRNVGWCPICEADAIFGSRDAWLRDCYVCESCGSLPRERALVHVLGQVRPDWRTLELHESSPAGASSNKLRGECAGYVASQWWADRTPGSVHDGVRCEDLEALTLADASVDVFVTQDVMEHVLDPAAAFREIARVLRPGGAHVFTTPVYRGLAASEVRARRTPEGIEHLQAPEYHGNPIDPAGALVTVHWAPDIVAQIEAATGLATSVYAFEEPAMGLVGEFLDVLVTRRPR